MNTNWGLQQVNQWQKTIHTKELSRYSINVILKKQKPFIVDILEFIAFNKKKIAKVNIQFFLMALLNINVIQCMLIIVNKWLHWRSTKCTIKNCNFPISCLNSIEQQFNLNPFIHFESSLKIKSFNFTWNHLH